MDLKDKQTIQKYLLGNLADTDIAELIESQLLSDDSFATQLAVAEDDLIETYIDNELSAEDTRKFEQFFLASPSRKKQFEFMIQLRDHAAERVRQKHPTTDLRSIFLGFFTFQKIGLASAILIAVVGGFFLLNRVTEQDKYDSGLIALNKAFDGKRPFEMRTSGMSYSPLAATRGNEKTESNLDRERAQSLLSEAATTEGSMRSFAALGKLYLLQNDLPRAEEYLTKAYSLDKANVELLNDLGALYLRKHQRSSEDDGSKMETINKSLSYLEAVIKTDPNMPEARFNYALALEAAKMNSGAAQAWRDYLQIDESSQWADEARKHIEMLESKKPLDRSAKEIEAAFLMAFDQKNDKAALQLIINKRELISETYLPILLSRSITSEADIERSRLIAAMEYVGDLELKTFGDRFPMEMAEFYKKLPTAEYEKIRLAQNSMSKGFEYGKDADWENALPAIENAKKIFDSLNNSLESSLCDFYIGYIKYNKLENETAKAVFEKIISNAKTKKYKWHMADVLYWHSAILRRLNKLNRSQAQSKEVLELALEINDPTLVQKSYNLAARQKAFFGQNKQALISLDKAFISSFENDSSLRQKWRNYSDGTEMLAKAGLMSYAKAVSRENINVSKAMQYQLYQTYAEIDAGLVHLFDNDTDTARTLFNSALKNAADAEDEQERKELQAKSLIQLGNLENKVGNFQNAIKLFDQALAMIDKEKQKSYFYEIIKGRLFAHSNLDSQQNLEQNIAEAIQAAETYRNYITKEDERSSFFDNQQSIYDIAIQYYLKNNVPEKAFNIAEVSNSRSLLDWIKRGSLSQQARNTIDGNFQEEWTETLSLETIKNDIGDDVQILQYAVLPENVVSWVITKNGIISRSYAISQDELNQTVKAFTDQVVSNKKAINDIDQTSSRLYEILIEPIEAELSAEKQLVIVPNKMLFKLPFAALKGRDKTPLLAKYDLQYSPSSNVFILCSKNAKKKNLVRTERLLSIGNPSFDMEKYPDMEDLPDAESEVDEIALNYTNKTLLKNDAATSDVFLSKIHDAEIIHFAGHYIVSHTSPLNSSLLMAKSDDPAIDSLVTNEALIKYQIPKAKLVVLSACQTGVEQYYNGEGLVGLSRTFMAAGVPLVIASHWKVDSEATAELMKKFHFYRRQNKMSSVAALRRSQLDIMSSPDGKYAHPFYWAAFAAFGGKANY